MFFLLIYYCFYFPFCLPSFMYFCFLLIEHLQQFFYYIKMQCFFDAQRSVPCFVLVFFFQRALSALPYFLITPIKQCCFSLILLSYLCFFMFFTRSAALIVALNGLQIFHFSTFFVLLQISYTNRAFKGRSFWFF